MHACFSYLTIRATAVVMPNLWKMKRENVKNDCMLFLDNFNTSEAEEHADCFCEDRGPDSALDMKECVELFGKQTHVRACSNDAVGMKRKLVKQSNTAQACRPQFDALDLHLVDLTQSSRSGLAVATQHRRRRGCRDEDALTKGNSHPNEEEAPGSESAPQFPPS